MDHSTDHSIEDCTFCRIVMQEIPASIVFEDEQLLAFLTIQPINPGHILLVPKVHHQTLNEMSEDLSAHFFKIAGRLQSTLRQSGLPCEGVNLWLCDGEAAGQEVPHVYLHIFPRISGDSFEVKANWHVAPPPQERTRISEQLRESYALLYTFA